LPSFAVVDYGTETRIEIETKIEIDSEIEIDIEIDSDTDSDTDSDSERICRDGTPSSTTSD
jgi:hypothetical protein